MEVGKISRPRKEEEKIGERFPRYIHATFTIKKRGSEGTLAEIGGLGRTVLRTGFYHLKNKLSGWEREGFNWKLQKSEFSETANRRHEGRRMSGLRASIRILQELASQKGCTV